VALFEISFTSKIVALKMNSTNIFAATKERIFLYDLRGMKLIKKIDCDNHLGRIVLSSNSLSNPYLLYSSSLREGILTVFNTHGLQEQCKIFCHNTPILKIAINYNGNMVATSSTQGTMIRVYSLPFGEKLYTFTRGIKMTTQYYLNFSRTDLFLLSTSETGTIHCFNLEEAETKTNREAG
jgi:autophagy-related protein 18